MLFCTLAFKEAGIELRWEGIGIEEKGIDKNSDKIIVEVDPKYFRPTEVEQLLGDPSKAKNVLGWNPTATSFEQLIKLMVKSDIRQMESKASTAATAKWPDSVLKGDSK